MNQTLSLAKKHILSIILVTLIGVVASIGLTLVQTPAYRSGFSLLVIEGNANVDGYAAAKSAERLSASLGRLMYTTTFSGQVFQRVHNTDLLKDDPLLTSDGQRQQQMWKHAVVTRVQPEVGMLQVSVYHENRAAATLLANALATILVEQGTSYLGGGQNVVLKVVDYPLTTKRPARPDVVTNVLAGLLLGFGASFGYLALMAMRGVNLQTTPQAQELAEQYQPEPVQDFGFSPVIQSAEPVPEAVQENNAVPENPFTTTYQEPQAEPAADDVTWRMP